MKVKLAIYLNQKPSSILFLYKMEFYKYEPLPSATSIRLIKLKEVGKTKELFCSLEVTDILVPPEYIALSYVWGDTTDTVPITCDGKLIFVTRTLKAALWKLTTTFSSILFWADALSIDQQNISERTQQVNIMASIYGKAAGVSIWLGPDPYNDATDVFASIKVLVEGLAIIQAMGAQFQHFDDDTGYLHWTLPDGSPHVSALPHLLVAPNEEEKGRLCRFLRLPWFSRTWVMQECGLAAESFLFWGDCLMEWNPVGVTALFLHRYCKAHLNSLNLASDVEHVRDLYLIFSPFVPTATFPHILHMARRSQARDPRDKVFALLSHPTAHASNYITTPANPRAFELYSKLVTPFLPDFKDMYIVGIQAQGTQVSAIGAPGSSTPLLKADYMKTATEVYLELARVHIERTQTLEILSFVQHDPKSTSDIFSPSWVPRWDYFVDTPIVGLWNGNHFAAANRRAIVTTPPIEDSNVLIVRGHLFSRIVLHTRVLGPSDFDLPLPSTHFVGPESSFVQDLWVTNTISSFWLKTGLAGCYDKGMKYTRVLSLLPGTSEAINLANHDGDLKEAYLRSWVLGKNLAETDSFDLQADSSAYWERLFYGTSGDPNQRTENTVNDNTQVKWKRYRDSAAHLCKEKKFFFTHRGLFGVGPGALKEGDRVAVLLGGDAPFVIREVDPDSLDPTKPVPESTKFKLVGECYVNGLMQGQLIRGREIERNIILI